MPVTKIKADGTGKEFLDAHKDSLVVLFFDGDFSGQKDIVEKAINALSNSDEIKDKISIALVDIEENTELAGEYSVVTVPTVVLVTKGKKLKTVNKLEPSQLIKIVDEELKCIDLIAGNMGDDKTAAMDPKQSYEVYLKSLTNRAPVMVFMKGHPSQPKCGFSRQLVELLERNKIKYDSFDILQDEDVRQGLKSLVDWPTYPQIYARGEFVGGLDILKQLEEQGELAKTLVPVE